MTPAEIDLTIYQGATFKKLFQWKTGDPPTPVNLTGYSARMQIREKIKSTSVISEFTTENGKIIFTDPKNGLFMITASAEETKRMKYKRGVYDIEFINPSGEVIRLIQGNVEFSPEVTR